MDQFGQRNPQLPLDDSWSVHMPAHAVELRTGVLLVGADALEPIHTAIEDVGQIGESLDIVYDGWATIEALDGGKRRLLARVSALSFQRFEQTCLLSADIRSSTRVQDDVEIVIRSEDVRSQEPFGACFGKRLVEHLV